MDRELSGAVKTGRNLLLAIGSAGIPGVGILVEFYKEYERLDEAQKTEGRFAGVERRLAELADAAERNPDKVRIVLLDLLRIAQGGGATKQFRHAESCFAVMRLLSDRSETGEANGVEVSWEKGLGMLRSVAGVTDPETEFELVAHELERSKLARKRLDMNSPAGFRSLVPTDEFFWRTDPLFQSWTPREDARQLCRISVQRGARMNHQIPEDFADLGWPRRRMSPAIDYLLAHKLTFNGPSGYYKLRAILLTAEGQLFAEEEPLSVGAGTPSPRAAVAGVTQALLP